MRKRFEIKICEDCSVDFAYSSFSEKISKSSCIILLDYNEEPVGFIKGLIRHDNNLFADCEIFKERIKEAKQLTNTKIRYFLYYSNFGLWKLDRNDAARKLKLE